MAAIADYLAVPYARRGFDGKGGASFRGASCWGLIVLYWRHERGIELPSYGGAARADMGDLFAAGGALCQRAAQPQRFDIVQLLRWSARRGRWETGHCAVMIDETSMLHTTARTGPLVQSIAEPEVATLIEAIWRLTPAYWGRPG